MFMDLEDVFFTFDERVKYRYRLVEQFPSIFKVYLDHDIVIYTDTSQIINDRNICLDSKLD